MKWFADCMLVNTGATATRVDPSRVSSSSMLLNVSVVLLKLCDPFVDDEKKHHKTNTVHCLSDKFNIPERTVWNILKRKISKP